jgi:hypothetical protein
LSRICGLLALMADAALPADAPEVWYSGYDCL